MNGDEDKPEKQRSRLVCALWVVVAVFLLLAPPAGAVVLFRQAPWDEFSAELATDPLLGVRVRYPSYLTPEQEEQVRIQAEWEKQRLLDLARLKRKIGYALIVFEIVSLSCLAALVVRRVRRKRRE